MPKNLTVRLDDDLAADTEALARAEGQSLNETVKSALRETVDRRRRDPKFKARLARSHPLPDGNKRAAWVAVRMCVETNGWPWQPRPTVDEAENAVLAVAVDPDGYRRSARQASLLGFDGKWAIHPDQIAIANEVIAPTASEVENAEAAIGTYRAAEADCVGAIGRDGRLVDAAHMRLAANTLHKTVHARGERDGAGAVPPSLADATSEEGDS